MYCNLKKVKRLSKLYNFKYNLNVCIKTPILLNYENSFPLRNCTCLTCLIILKPGDSDADLDENSSDSDIDDKSDQESEEDDQSDSQEEEEEQDEKINIKEERQQLVGIH